MIGYDIKMGLAKLRVENLDSIYLARDKEQ
jgi:hypothetical protein